MEMPFPRVGAGVNELIGIDSSGGVSRHITNIVGARTARCKSQILHALDDMNRVLCRDLPELQIGAGGHMRIAAAEFFREVRYSSELQRRKNSVGNAQPAHVTVLRRSDVEETVKPP